MWDNQQCIGTGKSDYHTGILPTRLPVKRKSNQGESWQYRGTASKTRPNPYDELPYRCLPIEWTAPERLAIASLLHGGPRSPLDAYRVLELGCGDGANLLPLAYYRRHGDFIGLDGARSQIEIADARKSALGIPNINFIHTDFLNATTQLSGQFDYIIAHGVFSWISNDVRDALLKLCTERLRCGGLLYLNYNTKPGWNVRGLVREFLLAQTTGVGNLQDRARRAQEVSAKIVSSFLVDAQPYSQLMAKEFQFVCNNHISYTAHEFLATDNHPYWRSEFLTLVQSYGLEYVADADFNYPLMQVPDDLAPRLIEEQLAGRTLDDTIDLLCYRQLHSPILGQGPLTRRELSIDDFADLFVASCLTPCSSNDNGNLMFLHPSGYEVEAKEEPIKSALIRLYPLWPQGLRIGALFSNVVQVMDDLKLLQRKGLIELRCIEPNGFMEYSSRLNRLEEQWGNGCLTTPYHTREDPQSHQNPENANQRNDRLPGIRTTEENNDASTILHNKY